MKQPSAIVYPPFSQCLLRTVRFLAREFLRDLRDVLSLL